MQILTPFGYRDIRNCAVGDEVVYFDTQTGEEKRNVVEKIERYTPDRFQTWVIDVASADEVPAVLDEDGNVVTEAIPAVQEEGHHEQDEFTHYLINGQFSLFKNQSIWRNASQVCHASDLQVGDVIFDDSNSDVVVATIEVDLTQTEWWRLNISGDCSYIADGITLHNASRYWVLGTGNTNDTAHWDAASGGAGGASVPTSSDDAHWDAGSNTSNAAYTVTVNAALDCNDLMFDAKPGDGLGGTITLAGSSVISVYGSMTLLSGMTRTYSGNITFAPTSGTKTITTSGKTLDFGITLNAPGATVQLADNLTMGATRTFTLTAGTLNLDGNTLSTGSFSSNNTNTRAITSGVGGITLTGNAATILDVGNATGFSRNDALTFTANYSGATGTRALRFGSVTGGTEVNVPSVSITAGTDQVTFYSCCRTLDFTGFAGIWAYGSTIVLYGDLVVSASVNLSITNTINLLATSGTQHVTTNGKVLDLAITQDGIGGTVQLIDNLTLNSARTFTLNAGTLDLNGKTLTLGMLSSNSSNVRGIKSSVNGGKIATLTDYTTPPSWNFTNTTNATIDRTTGTWTIEVGGNTTNIRMMYLGAGISWPVITFTNTTANGELDIVSSGTATVIKSLAVSVPPQTIKRTAGTTIGIEDTPNGMPSGTAGNLVTLGSITAATHTWAGASAETPAYLSISRSTAPSNWDAGATSTNGGNNSGWLFGTPAFSVAVAMHHLKLMRG